MNVKNIAPNGKGTFKYNKSKGTFEYAVYIKELGRNRSFYGSDWEICEAKYNNFIRRFTSGTYSLSGDINTIPDILLEYHQIRFDSGEEGEVGFNRNRDTIKIVEKSKLGKIPIQFIEEKDILAFLNQLKWHYSQSVIDKVYQNLKKAFEYAVEDGLISKNPFLKTNKFKKPKSSKQTKKIDALTHEEQRIFLNAIKDYSGQNGRNNYAPQLLIAFYTGMRIGEINALKKEDINLQKNTISIKRTVARVGNDCFVSDRPKTAAGVRIIPIPSEIKPILEKAVSKAKKNGLLFYDINNKIIGSSQVNSFYRRLCEKYGIKYSGQHSLRHTYATRCVEAGVEPSALMYFMGHTDIRITINNYYTHQAEFSFENLAKIEEYNSKIFEAND